MSTAPALGAGRRFGSAGGRIDHLRRAAGAYLLRRASHLDFWHERPALNEQAFSDVSGLAVRPYPMTLRDKADYAGPFDERGVPLLDYRGGIGRQYNPIAIAQYALAGMNRDLAGGGSAGEARWRPAVDWLCESLTPNRAGVPVWLHRFDWPYRETLRNPWYSGLAQGQGVSALLRAWRLTGASTYWEAARRAWASLETPVGEGGVLFEDDQGNPWIEEYVVDPPSHILNGFLWALWGVRDMGEIGGESGAHELFRRCVRTLVANLERFDTGYWSLYELGGTRLPMLAGQFYHSLHVVQLDATWRMTGQEAFRLMAGRWRGYRERRANRSRALVMKSLFKVLYY